MRQTQQETLFIESVYILCTSAYCSTCSAKNNLFFVSLLQIDLSKHQPKNCFDFGGTHFFYKKLRLGPSTENFLAFGDLEYLKFLNSFLTFS